MGRAEWELHWTFPTASCDSDSHCPAGVLQCHLAVVSRLRHGAAERESSLRWLDILLKTTATQMSAVLLAAVYDLEPHQPSSLVPAKQKSNGQ